MGSKEKPGVFDCYANAESSEPMFILLARDPWAAHLVEEWARLRRVLVAEGRKPESDLAMVAEAEECAKTMREWRRTHRDGPGEF